MKMKKQHNVAFVGFPQAIMENSQQAFVEAALTVNCRGCLQPEQFGLSALSWLSVMDYENFRFVREDYFLTYCGDCRKYTATSMRDLPDNLQDEFWSNKLPYYVAVKYCECDKHPTERMVTLEELKKNYIHVGTLTLKCAHCKCLKFFPRDLIRYEVRSQAPETAILTCNIL
jgi:hypothetical protein